MRSTLRTRATLLTASGALFAGCHGATIPRQVLTRPAPVAAPAAVARTSGPWAYRPSLQRQGFALDERAVLTIRTDTLLNTDTVSSHVEVSFTVATNGISGAVGAFAVQNASHETATPAGLDLPFPFRASFTTRGMQVDFLAPRDTTPCASRALAVAQSLRDLWFRPPDTLRVGVTWGDSASYLLCRDGIPLRATVYRTFRITGTAEQDGRAVLSISRVSRTTIEGSGVQFGEPVDVSGSGSADLVYVFDPAVGEIMSAGGHATVDLSFRSRLRTQAVRQLVAIRIGRS